jgi:hypothetical protein
MTSRSRLGFLKNNQKGIESMTAKYETLIVDARLTNEEEFSDILSYMSEKNAVVNQIPTNLYDKILDIAHKLEDKDKLIKHREKINSIFKAQERKE